MPSIVGTWKLVEATARDAAGKALPTPYGGEAMVRDRMNPDGDIPMHPGRGDRGVGLEFVTKELGSKVGMFGGAMPRQVESIPARPS
jgi:hypothetical protein